MELERPNQNERPPFLKVQFCIQFSIQTIRTSIQNINTKDNFENQIENGRTLFYHGSTLRV